MSKADTRHAPEEIDGYLTALPNDIRSSLERVRSIVRETAPECTERVSYQIPMFRLRKDLVGMAAQKNYCALHIMSPPLMEAMAEELKGVKVSGATTHFTPEHPLPKELIERIVRERMQEAGFVWQIRGFCVYRKEVTLDLSLECVVNLWEFRFPNCIHRGRLALSTEAKADACLIEVTPEKEFITYGVGVPLLRMHHLDQARGCAPVASDSPEADTGSLTNIYRVDPKTWREEWNLRTAGIALFTGCGAPWPAGWRRDCRFPRPGGLSQFFHWSALARPILYPRWGVLRGRRRVRAKAAVRPLPDGRRLGAASRTLQSRPCWRH